MPIRLSHSTIWDRDWFLSIEGKYQLFCLYLRDHCDHAGVWQPSFKRFEQTTGFRIDPKEYLSAVNTDNTRIAVLDNGKWWIVGFIEDQYKTNILNPVNNAIKGVINSLDFNSVPYLSSGYKVAPSRGLVGAKEKDKEKDNSSSLKEEESIRRGIEYSESFIEFWKAYPRKESKADAWKAWSVHVAKNKIENATIISAIEWQRKSNQWTKDNGQFIPMPATWIRGHRWEDQPVEALPTMDQIRKSRPKIW